MALSREVVVLSWEVVAPGGASWNASVASANMQHRAARSEPGEPISSGLVFGFLLVNVAPWARGGARARSVGEGVLSGQIGGARGIVAGNIKRQRRRPAPNGTCSQEAPHFRPRVSVNCNFAPRKP